MNGFSHHTLHQALEWVQNSPPLFNRSANPLCLDHPLPAGITPLLPNTGQLDILDSLINRKGNPLLGIFYETLWQFLLSQFCGSHLLASNLQVRGEKNGQPTTLGEYDLIYQLRNQYIHRELSVKFYLGIPAGNTAAKSSPWQHWIGPGLKDRLDLKMDRLLHHQATLSDTEEGQKTLLNRGIHLPVQKEILIQGRLFYPLYPLNTTAAPAMPLTELFHSTTRPEAAQLCPPPRHCNPNHLQGYWLTQNQFLQSTTSRSLDYQLPLKVQWLNQSPFANHLNHDELMVQLRKQHPVYIRVIHRELQRQLHVFIVPDNWPDKAGETLFQQCR